jgi:glycosyltransferase involved in cell wall biosynthesis
VIVPEDNHEKPFLSIVIPIYNEEGNILELYRNLLGAIREVGRSYEIIFVNDGSSDHSIDLIKELHLQNSNIRLISFSRNYGHQAALTAGLQYSAGEIVITMDGDLQHPPHLIPKMIEYWKNGYETVHMVKEKQEERGFLKNILASGFYYVFSKISEVDMDPNASDFRLMSRKVVNALNAMPEQHRFIRGLAYWMGFRSTKVPYVAPKRFSGEPKYSVFKLAKLASAGVLSFSVFPLRASLYVGVTIASLSFLYALFAAYKRIFIGNVPVGYTDMMFFILFLGGVQLVFLGVIGEYLAKVFQEVRRRPLYVINETIGFSN